MDGEPTVELLRAAKEQVLLAQQTAYKPKKILNRNN